MKVIVTGGAGFIGSNYVKQRLQKNEESLSELLVIDNLTYAGTRENLESVRSNPKFTFVQGDICDEKLVDELFNGADEVIHFAAESHVDRSIESSSEFIRTNVLGTNTLLNALRKHTSAKFLHVSTDEVYGSIQEGSWTEEFPLAPNSPYSASKAASDLLVLSYYKTYGLNLFISRCCNNYGPNQFPEKIIPLFITNIMRGKKLPVYGDGSNSREWIHVKDHCSALDLILESGMPGQIYNIGSGVEISNLDLTKRILHHLNRSEEDIEYVADRLGHDFRYSLDSTRIESGLGFQPCINFDDGLDDTIKWYLKNENWWKSKVVN
jgi:dTDP-glucose 4,6-dehydratase